MSDDSPLSRLEKRLYGKNAIEGADESALSERAVTAPTGWKHEDPIPEGPEKPKLASSVVFLLCAFGFFVIAGITATVLLFMGGRSVSNDNVRITVEGPTTVAGGDTLSLLVTIENRNPVAVAEGSLELVFPDGSYKEDGTNTPITRVIEDIGDIPAGQKVTRTIRAVVFGNEDQDMNIPLLFEYQTSQSSVVFEKTTSYDFTVGTSPVDVAVTSVSELSSGQELSISVSVRSNAATTLENIGVVAHLPFGFSLNSAEPAPSSGNIFIFPRIPAGEEAKITLSGVLTGQDNDERVFRFTVGSVESLDARALSVVYTTKETEVQITKPFLAVSMLLNRAQSEPTIVQAGAPIQALLSWTNTLPTAVLDGEITVRIQGTAFDPESVSTANGFFRSSDASIVFSAEQDIGLKNLKSGDQGNGSFTFSTKTGSAMNALRNPTIILTTSIKGRRVTESSVPENISATITRTIQVASDLTVTARGVYSVGPFLNTGPWPPKVDQKTTYTIVLSAGNTVNSVAGAKAVMTIPSSVAFTGATSPADAKITYNATTREITWDIRDIPAGTVKREAAFQVELLPSLSQEGKSPVLVNSLSVSGFDRFIGRDLLYTGDMVTTKIDTDPAYQVTNGNVTR
jgi:hypothetical protein